MKTKRIGVYVDDQEKAYQPALFQQGQPTAMFHTSNVKGAYERAIPRVGATEWKTKRRK